MSIFRKHNKLQSTCYLSELNECVQHMPTHYWSSLWVDVDSGAAAASTRNTCGSAGHATRAQRSGTSRSSGRVPVSVLPTRYSLNLENVCPAAQGRIHGDREPGELAGAARLHPVQ